MKPNGHPAQSSAPVAFDAERAVLCCAMLSVEAADDPTFTRLQESDFADLDHRRIFRHIRALRADGRATECELITARMEAHGDVPDSRQRVELLKQIMQSQANHAHVRHYAELVWETSRRREQLDFANRIREEVAAGLPIDDIDGLVATFLSNRPSSKQDSPTMRNLQHKNTALRPPIVHGLLRQGETMNIIAPTKVGKSWMVHGLALSIVTGRLWLDRFECERGDALIVDNELHEETITDRITKVADALHVPVDDYADNLRVEAVRGRMMNIHDLGLFLQRYSAGQFKAVILDAFYKFLPSGVDENSNADMARMYALIDSYAARLKCCFICVHHASKGNQSSKAVTDVGAGAGAQSRATDTHFVLRQHEQDGAFVVDGVTRSFAPFDPFCLRWQFPTWMPADELDPAELRKEKKSAKPKAETPEPWTPDRFVEEFVTDAPTARAAIITAATEAGLSNRKANNLLNVAIDTGKVFKWIVEGTNARPLATVPQPEPCHV